MTDTITITAGRANREPGDQEFDGPDGTYPVTLVAISDPVTEASNMPTKRKGDDGTWTYRDWTLAIDGTDRSGQLIDIRANARSAGPASKQYALVAGFLGRTPSVGEAVDIKSLIGREALARIVSNDAGWPKVDTVFAKPQQAAPAAPVAPPAPVAPAVAEAPAGDALPF